VAHRSVDASSNPDTPAALKRFSQWRTVAWQRCSAVAMAATSSPVDANQTIRARCH